MLPLLPLVMPPHLLWSLNQSQKLMRHQNQSQNQKQKQKQRRRPSQKQRQRQRPSQKQRPSQRQSQRPSQRQSQRQRPRLSRNQVCLLNQRLPRCTTQVRQGRRAIRRLAAMRRRRHQSAT